jgi:hypothetical protein
MGADKYSSPKRELGLCPKFTNKDSHTSLPRSRSHNGPTNPMNKPHTILKRKHDSRSKGLSSPAKPQADCPRPPGGPSAWVRQTVRELRRTVRKTTPNLQYCTLNNGPSAMGPRTVRPATDRPRASCNKNPPTKWIGRKTRKNSRRTRRTPSHPAPRGLSAPTRRTVHQVRTDARIAGREQECELPTTYFSMDLPNDLSS